MAGIPTSIDPMGSVITSVYTKNQVLGVIANPQTAEQQWLEVDLPDNKSVIYTEVVGGGNTSKWCYLGCYHAGSAGAFIGELVFSTKCHVKIGIGLNGQPSRIQVAVWGNKSTWYDLVICDNGYNANGNNGGGGRVTVNRGSTFNTYRNEREITGNGGSLNGYGASVLYGYGSGGVNGYGKLMYSGRK